MTSWPFSQDRQKLVHILHELPTKGPNYKIKFDFDAIYNWQMPGMLHYDLSTPRLRYVTSYWKLPLGCDIIRNKAYRLMTSRTFSQDRHKLVRILHELPTEIPKYTIKLYIYYIYICWCPVCCTMTSRLHDCRRWHPIENYHSVVTSSETRHTAEWPHSLLARIDRN